MAIQLRDEDVAHLKQALSNGTTSMENLLHQLKGQAVEGIRTGLHGTETATAFTNRVEALEVELKRLTPQFEQLGQFVQQYMDNFHEADRAQARSLG